MFHPLHYDSIQFHHASYSSSGKKNTYVKHMQSMSLAMNKEWLSCDHTSSSAGMIVIQFVVCFQQNAILILVLKRGCKWFSNSVLSDYHLSVNSTAL